jgi:hypothetical protein
MELRFVASESTFAYFEALNAYLRRHGKPTAPASPWQNGFAEEEDLADEPPVVREPDED